MVTWALVLGLIYTLRSLFAVIFITFVVSYICRNVVRFFYGPFGDRGYIRKVIVIVTFLALLSGFYLGGRFLVPNIIEQGRQVVNRVKEMRLHEDLGNALPNLYASIRYSFYEGGAAYTEDLEAFKTELADDPVKLGIEAFRAEAMRIRGEFMDLKAREEGQKIYDRDKDTAAYAEAFSAWMSDYIEKEVYEKDRDRLERGKEAELKGSMSDADFEKRFKSKYATPEAWSRFLKDFILMDIYKTIEDDPDRKDEYETRFRMQYKENAGRDEAAKRLGTEAWDEEFAEYYEGLTIKDYELEQFLELEKARDQEEYIRILGGEGGEEGAAEVTFEKEKLKEYAQTFRSYGLMEWLNEKIKNEVLPMVLDVGTQAVESTVSLIIQLIISVFLSFFIVWDIPRLKKLVSRLGTSRIRNFYEEVAPGMVSFGWLMGRAFQAQAIIAVVNTALTLSALALLDIPHRTFLSSIVFICSFIPVVGTIISSVPLVVVSIQEPNGLILALEVVGCILVIHFIETTLLNPKIMGDMLKLHPLLVLVILLVGEHFFGIWGLLLGVPIAVYIFRFVILKDQQGPLQFAGVGDDPPPGG